ncbi:MAG TPA: hypothetical protein VIJ14_04000, partial [Rhabdochlamydiaceae bacterium]
ISCNGKPKIKYYQLLCTAFGIPFFTLFDLDNEEEKGGTNSDIIASADGEHFFGFKESLSISLGVPQNERKSPATMEAIDNCTTLNEEFRQAFDKLKSFAKKL